MRRVVFSGGDIEVSAELLAAGLGLPAAQVRALMREGAIRGRCERGEGTDAGRQRLTFIHRGRQLRLIIDAGGCVIGLTRIGPRPALPGRALPIPQPKETSR